jgi:hypothetical protein
MKFPTINEDGCRYIAATISAALIFFYSEPGAAQPSVPFPQDNHALRYILDKLELQPLAGLEGIGGVADPKDCVLLVLGETDVVEHVPTGVKNFVKQGGALLLATDRSTKVLEKEFGVAISGDLLTTADLSKAYREKLPGCPIVIGIEGKQPPLFQGLKRVATNRPSYLEARTNELTVLAYFPRECQIEGRVLGPPNLPLLTQRRAFAAAGRIGKGRVLVLSDHSVFINDMMMQPDNDNFDFAYACLQWLSSGRRHALLVDEGIVYTSFKVPVREGSELPTPPAELWNQLLLGLERDDILNRLILRRFSVNQVISALLLVFTLGLMGYGYFRLARGSYSVDPDAPLAVSNVGAAVQPPGLVQQRHQTMLREGKLWEAARDLARQSLLTLGHSRTTIGVPSAGTVAGRSMAPQPPRIMVDGRSWRKRRRLRDITLRVWELAHAGQPRLLSHREFRQLVGQIQELKQAALEGKVQLDGVKK